MLSSRIAGQKPASKLSCEIEFPDEDNALSFIPFLGTQCKVNDDVIMSKFYRKPQKKTLSFMPDLITDFRPNLKQLRNSTTRQNTAQRHPSLSDNLYYSGR